MLGLGGQTTFSLARCAFLRPPSHINNPTGTYRDVLGMQPDGVVMYALQPLLDDNMASARSAAQEAITNDSSILGCVFWCS